MLWTDYKCVFNNQFLCAMPHLQNFKRNYEQFCATTSMYKI